MNSYEMKAVSEKFISHLQSALAEHGIQLSVTNTKGTIIASSIEAFCGKFCAPAFRASERKQTVSASSEDSRNASSTAEGVYIPFSPSGCTARINALQGMR